MVLSLAQSESTLFPSVCLSVIPLAQQHSQEILGFPGTGIHLDRLSVGPQLGLTRIDPNSPSTLGPCHLQVLGPRFSFFSSV